MQSAKRIALVTGANKGIGLAIATKLAQQPSHFVLVGARSLSKAQEAEQLVRKAVPSGQVGPLVIDLDDEKSIIAAAQTVKETHGGLDILVNNAAIAFKGDAFDENVVRVTMHTNYYGTLAVLNHFLPLVRPGARVVNVASQAGTMALHKCSPALQAAFLKEDLTVDELNALVERFRVDVSKDEYKQNGWPKSAYGISKAAVIALTRILARDNKKDNVLINACCPGFVATDMSSFKGNKTPEQGAVTPVYLATLPHDAAVTGKFFVNQKVAPVTTDTFEA